MRSFLVAVALASLLTLGITACGGSGSSVPPPSSGGESTKAASTAAIGTIPPDLLGTWATTLKAADLPAEVPPELTNAAAKWELQIAATGGTNNGPVLSIVNPELGQLEGPTFEVDGSQLKLLQEECAASGETKFFDNAYSYTIKGDTLQITTVKNQCADRVAEIILTSEPWKRSG